jgi:hypothetical protein
LPGGEGPVDPDYGVDVGGRPDQGLPPYPDQGLPTPPPGVWPPLTPSHPIQPVPPGSEVPPGTIWPPVGGPSHPIAPGGGGGHPDQGLPGQPPRPDQGLPPGSPGTPTHPIQPTPTTFWVVAGIPGVGWRYIAVDPSLRPGHLPSPQPPAHPDQGLPPTAQPRR